MKNQKLIRTKLDILVAGLPNSKYKMGETKTLTLKSGSFEMTSEIDCRTYYEGRGAKYNSSIRHGSIDETISMAELNRRWSNILKIRKATKQLAIERKENAIKTRIENEKKSNSNTPFDIEIKENEVKLYNFIRIDLDEITAFLQIHNSNIKKEHVEHNYFAWQRDFKSQIMIDKNNALFTPCGCNAFRIDLWQTEDFNTYIC